MTSIVIDTSYLFYVNPSDSPGINFINQKLIDIEKYRIWSCAMLIALQAKNKLAFIYGSFNTPDSRSNKLLQCERCNAIFFSWIMNVFSKEIFSGIVYSVDAVVVWDDLRK